MSDPKDRLGNASTLPGGAPAGRDGNDGGDSSMDDTLPGKRKSPYAKGSANKRHMGLAETLPQGTSTVATADTAPLDKLVIESEAPAPSKTWEHDGVIASTSGGPIDDGDEPVRPSKMVSESEARTILSARFTAAGAALQQDYTFQRDDLAVTLDGYDPERKLGFAYLSHSDVDVVTDFDAAAELAFQQFAADGVAFVLVIHDSDTPSTDALERRIDAFFAQLHRATRATETF